MGQNWSAISLCAVGSELFYNFSPLPYRYFKRLKNIYFNDFFPICSNYNSLVSLKLYLSMT